MIRTIKRLLYLRAESLTYVMKHIIHAGLILSFLQSCLPENQSLDQSLKDSIGVSRTLGFKGLETVQTITGSKLQLTWNESTDPEVVAYNIYDTTNMFNRVLVATIPVPSSGTFLTKGANGNALVPGSYYSFNVKAVTAKQKEDDNTINKGAIPYSGVIGYQIIDGSTVKLTINNPANADRAKAFCRVGLTAVTETLLGTLNDLTKSEITLTGLSAGVQYTCRVALEVGTFIDNNTVTVTFTPLGTATQLVFATQPTNGQAGVTWSSQPVIQIQDSNGNIVSAGPDSNASITLTISSGTVSGTVFLNAVGGVATFTGLSTADMGVKTLTATKEDKSGMTNGAGVLTAVSNQFTIAAGPVSPLFSSITKTVLTGADPLIANGNDSYKITVTLKDQYGNPVSGTLPQVASSLAVFDNVTQSTVATNANGEAYATIATTLADENRKVSITSPSGLETLFVSTPFVAGQPVWLSYLVQPVYTASGIADFKVAVTDSNNNVVKTSTAAITVSISSATNPNGAILIGTNTVNAVSGVATFTGLNIDKAGNGYKLIATATSLRDASSSSFNVTAGIPTKIMILGANYIRSSATPFSQTVCAPITVQLQDIGGNPSKPSVQKNVVLSGLGSAKLFSGSTCTGTALNASSSYTLSFTSSTASKTLYLADTKSEVLNLTATEGTLTTGTKTFVVTPSQLTLTKPIGRVISGSCSANPLIITPMGSDGSSAPIALNTVYVNISGLSANMKLYTDSSCSTTPINPSNYNLPLTTGLSDFGIKLYIKDDYYENLSINVSDLSAVVAEQMTTTSSAQAITVLPSDIELSGPTKIVAGQCSDSAKATVFNIKLKDKAGNYVTPTVDIVLKINGLSGTNGKFYTALANCSAGTSSITTTVTYPANSASMNLYFKDLSAERISLSLADNVAGTPSINTSNVISLAVSPAALNLSGSAFSSKTSDCVALTLSALDAASPPKVTAAVDPITVNLTASGYSTGFESAGKFYEDSSCATAPKTSTILSSGLSSKQIYFKGLYPAASLNLIASDAGSVLTQSSLPWSVSADKAFLGIGTYSLYGTTSNAGEKVISFVNNPKNFIGAIDYPKSIVAMTTDPTGRFLYVADFISDPGLSRVLKYDLVRNRYIGWIGKVKMNSTLTAPTGSAKNLFSENAYTNLPTPGSCGGAALANLGSGGVTPGWCQGGYAEGGAHLQGGFSRILDIKADDKFIYVLQAGNNAISRFYADSGKFAGVMGTKKDDSGNMVSEEGASGCESVIASTTVATVLPGWCSNGSDRPLQDVYFGPSANVSNAYGNGSLGLPSSMAIDQDYIYIAQWSSVLRYSKASGQFAGWIGGYGTLSGEPQFVSASGNTYGCPSQTQSVPGNSGVFVQGWCIGGSYSYSQVPDNGIFRPSSILVAGDQLLVQDTAIGNNYPIKVFDRITGHYIKTLTNLGFSLHMKFGYYDSSTGYVVGIDRQDMNNSTKTTAPNIAVIDINTSGGAMVNWMGKLDHRVTSSCSKNSFSYVTDVWCGTSFGKNISGLDFGFTYALLATPLADSDYNVDFGVRNRSLFAIAPIIGGSFVASLNEMLTEIKRFNFNTGAYEGSIAPNSDSPSTTVWNEKSAFDSSGALDARNFIAAPGFSDNQYYDPNGVYVEGSIMYIADSRNGRIKKIDVASGKVIGIIGGITSKPTSGDTGCTSLNPFSVSEKWCLGAMPNTWSTAQKSLIADSVDGLLAYPAGIVGDGDANGFLYVTDSARHRVNKFKKDGTFVGWIGGNISTNPTTCGNNGPPNIIGTGQISYTGSWCKGGVNAAAAVGTNWSSNAPGGYTIPTGITYQNGKLYILDTYPGRIVKVDAASGAFEGWIGGVYAGSGIPSGLTTACSTQTAPGGSSRITNGWCNDNSSTSGWLDIGTFKFFVGSNFSNKLASTYFNELFTISDLQDSTTFTNNRKTARGNVFFNIASDSQYLYVPNPNAKRIDKINITTGNWVGSYSSRWNEANGSTIAKNNRFSTNTADILNTVSTASNQSSFQALSEDVYSMPVSVAVDNNFIYYISQSDSFDGSGQPAVVKIKKGNGVVNGQNYNDGDLIGWKGWYSTKNQVNGLITASSDTSSDTSSLCSSGSFGYAKAWCRGGSSAANSDLGGFLRPRGIYTDDYFVYVTDMQTHRVTRLPKSN